MLVNYVLHELKRMQPRHAKLYIRVAFAKVDRRSNPGIQYKTVYMSHLSFSTSNFTIMYTHCRPLGL